MNKTRKVRMLTGAILVCVTATLIAYDIYAIMAGGVEATISRVILETSASMPILAFAAGVLCGHLFWPQDRRAIDVPIETPGPVTLRFPLSPPDPVTIKVREKPDGSGQFVGVPRLANLLNLAFTSLKVDLQARIVRQGVLSIQSKEEEIHDT
jgi:hypothetical protein